VGNSFFGFYLIICALERKHLHIMYIFEIKTLLPMEDSRTLRPQDRPSFFTKESWISPAGISDAPVGAYLDACWHRSPVGEILDGCCHRSPAGKNLDDCCRRFPVGRKLVGNAHETPGKKESIRFSEEPLSLMRETLHNVQGMKAHSEIQFSLDSD